MEKLTPMMKQYREMKEQHRDAVLFFRLGDFYEMFESDAEIASSILNLNLTKRNGKIMCGLPYHAAQNYILRLLKAGKKIAICEQVTKPGEQKGIVERKVTRVITPGTVVEDSFLDSSTSNYLVSFSIFEEYLSCSYIEMSTGDFYISKNKFQSETEIPSLIRKEIARLNPAEILIQESMLDFSPGVADVFDYYESIMLNRFPDWNYDINTSLTRVTSILKTAGLKGFGIENDDPALHSVNVLLDYIDETSQTVLSHVRDVKLYVDSDYLVLDESTRNNLEIVKNLRDSSSRYTLFSVLDYTKTAAGRRLLKHRLQNPLLNIAEIENRLDKVEYLYKNQILLNHLRKELSTALDLQRLISKIAMNRANAKDLVAVRQTLSSLAGVYKIMLKNNVPDIFEFPDIDKIEQLYDFLQQSILDEPSLLLTDGKMIRPGFSKELDRLKNLRKDSKQILEEYLDSEKQASGISNLKVKYNKIIGYFIEVTKGNASNVPNHFIRRQSLVSSERFTTDRLAELEVELNNATENAVDLEKEIFLKIREQVKSHMGLLHQAAALLSDIDFIQSSAYCASVRGFNRPVLKESEGITIKGGRHPVVEAELRNAEFVPNDTELSLDSKFFTILTGPNMAGKSTYLRQSALIVLMAQSGIFVPAAHAEIGVVDRIFCRVGASDNLARGESTFLVEMNETANILRNAGNRSLVIMDEVGRGTSTNDGLSIARAVCEFLIQNKIKTLFATHYHELTLIKDEAAVNKSLKVSDSDGRIVFLKQVVDGACGSSYGLHAAALAGLPTEVLSRAADILSEITANEEKRDDIDYSIPAAPVQDELFSPQSMLLQEIVSFDMMNNTPFKLMKKFEHWQKKIKEIL